MLFNKKILVLLLCLLLANIIVAQTPRAVTLAREYNSSQKAYEYNAVNNDYCPYYIVIDLSRAHSSAGKKHSSVLRPGKNFLFRFKVEDAIPVTSSTFRFYKGDINAKVQADYHYALPVAAGNPVQARVASGGRLIFSLRHTSDTVYASRDGLVCSDEFINPSLKGKLLTIYHKDGTFADYSELQEVLVKSGEKVKTGMPIAIVRTNDRGYRYVGLRIIFLDKNKMNDSESNNKYTVMRPFFHTKNHGVVRPEENITYIGEITDEVLMQDMTKKERQNYLKKKK